MTGSPVAEAATPHHSTVREVFREVSRAWAAGDASAAARRAPCDEEAPRTPVR